MGDLSELAKEYKGSGFRIIGLSADAMPENPDMVLSSKEMFESAGGNFTNIIASQSVIKTMLQGVNTVHDEVLRFRGQARNGGSRRKEQTEMDRYYRDGDE